MDGSGWGSFRIAFSFVVFFILVALFPVIFALFLFVFFVVFVFGNSSKQGVGYHAISG